MVVVVSRSSSTSSDRWNPRKVINERLSGRRCRRRRRSEDGCETASLPPKSPLLLLRKSEIGTKTFGDFFRPAARRPYQLRGSRERILFLDMEKSWISVLISGRFIKRHEFATDSCLFCPYSQNETTRSKKMLHLPCSVAVVLTKQGR